MTYMYLANCTPQRQEFQFWLKERKQGSPFRIPIEVGQQVRIPVDLSQPDIDYIIEQHGKYGFTFEDEVDRTRSRYVTLVYQFGKRVNMEKVRRVIEGNFIILDRRGQEIRKNAAIAVSNTIQQQLDPRQATLGALEMSVEEQGKDATFAEGLRVADEEPGRPVPPRRLRVPRRKAA